MRPITRLISAAILATSLSLAASPAFAFSYSEKFEVFEKESGEPTRMALYAKATAMELPSFDEAANRTAVLALANPFSQDLSFLKNYAAEYDPAAKLFYDATAVKNYKHFTYTAPDDPVAAPKKLQNIATYLILRSQTNAAAGSMNAAIDDVSAVWLAGHSMQTTNNSIYGLFSGTALRSMALDQMSAMLENKPLTLAQQTRMIALMTKQPPDLRSTMGIIEDDIRLWPAMLRPQNVATPEKLEEASKIMLEAVKPLESLDFRKQKAMFPEIEAARQKAEETIGKGQSTSVVDVLNRKAVVDAKQAVLLTGLCVSAANTQSATGKATTEEITALVAPIQDFLRDPFTGESPRVSNEGNGKFLISSAGPDGIFNTGEMKVYSSRFGVVSDGDIYLQKK